MAARISNRALIQEVDELRTFIVEQMAEATANTDFADPAVAIASIGDNKFYTLKDVKAAAIAAYAAFHQNPLIKRAINLRNQYVFGKGFAIVAKPDVCKDVVDDFFDRNKRILGHAGLMELSKTLDITGNLFIMAKVDEKGAVTLQSVPINEITGYLHDPDDPKNIWYWKRSAPRYTVNGEGGYDIDITHSKYHPAFGFEPDAKPSAIEGIAVEWSKPILHTPLNRVGNEVFAMPSVVTVLPWARAYTGFLSNVSSINAALARFAWKATAKTAEGAKAIKKELNTQKQQPVPVGSTFTSTDGITLEPIRTGGVTTGADEGRRLALMVGSGTDTPEQLLMSDPSTGNLATTKVMERPYELSIVDRQRGWEDDLETLVLFAIEQRIKSMAFVPLKGDVVVDEYGRKIVKVWADVEVEADPMPTPSSEPLLDPVISTGDLEPEPEMEPEPVAVQKLVEVIVEASFPSVLEHDMLNEVDAITMAATLKGLPLAGIMDYDTMQKLLLRSLNIADVEDTIAAMDKAEIEEQRDAFTKKPERFEAFGGGDEPRPGSDELRPGSPELPATLSPPVEQRAVPTALPEADAMDTQLGAIAEALYAVADAAKPKAGR